MTALLKGPLLHWGAVLAVACSLLFAGLSGLHVRQFNLFLVIVLGVSLALVLLVALTARPRAEPNENEGA